MIFAVHYRSNILNENYQLAEMITALFTRLAKIHTQHQFVLLISEQKTSKEILPNLVIHGEGPSATHYVAVKYWYDYKLPSLLKKYKADLFICLDSLCSLRTGIPQYLVSGDYILQNNNYNKKGFLQERLIRQSIRKAKRLSCFSDSSKKIIGEQYGISPGSIDIIPPFIINEPGLISVDERNHIKAEYADGKEYFIYHGCFNPQLINLLKSFSLFKKRQRTSMKLLLLGKNDPYTPAFLKELASYRYREDVKVLTDPEPVTISRIISAAYGVIHINENEFTGIPALEAIHAHVPLIAALHTTTAEIAGDMGLFADPFNNVDIAQQMMMLYKDENLRNTLSKKAKTRAEEFNLKLTIDALWTGMMQAVKKQ